MCCSNRIKKGFLILVFLLIATKLIYAERVDPLIGGELEDKGEASVIVMLKDEPELISQTDAPFMQVNEAKKAGLEQKKLMVGEQQERVLSKLNMEDYKKQTKNSSFFDIDNVDFKLKHKYSTVNGFSGKITKHGLEKLVDDSNVKSIQLNKRVYATLDNSAPLIKANSSWGIVLNGTNITGVGETVCVIDTGVDYNHSDLGGGWGNKVIGGYRSLNQGADTEECSLNNSACFDDHGHGTHVTGIVASTNSIYKGVAPDAKIIAVKVLDSTGSGWSDDIIAGIDWCTNNASKFNISVITLSLGDCSNHTTYCNTDSEASSINTAVGQGIVVTIAAGNCNQAQCPGQSCTAGPSSPACVENATAVGAVNDADSITYQRGGSL